MIISCGGCAYFKAIAGLFGSSSSANHGTEVSGNKLHVGHETTALGGVDYEDVGAVHHNYLQQTGGYVVDIAISGGFLALCAFIIFRFFKFLRRVIEVRKKLEKT